MSKAPGNARVPMLQVGERLRLVLGELAFGGAAVARSPHGQVVLVDGGVPGDEADVCLQVVKRRYARGVVERVVVPGPARVDPVCPLVERCGGCPWQATALSVQQAAKQAIVTRALAPWMRSGSVSVDPLIAATPAFGYRSRARMTVLRTPGRPIQLGFAAARSHALVDIPRCPVLDPRLDAAFGAVRRTLLAALPAGATVAGLVGTGAVHLALRRLGGQWASIRQAAARVLGEAGIVGVLVEGEALGAADIDTAAPGEPAFWASADGFAQASAAGNQGLRQVVREAMGMLLARQDGRVQSPRLLELHAGDGNFTRDLILLGEVTAVEGGPEAAARLKRNVPGAYGVAASVEAHVAALAGRGERFDAVLLDPPRTGAAEILGGLERLTDRIVYVSCDPMTLARDASRLVQAGFAIIQVAPLDLMPHAAHVETVCVLER